MGVTTSINSSPLGINQWWLGDTKNENDGWKGWRGRALMVWRMGAQIQRFFGKQSKLSKNILPQIFCPKIRLTIPSDDVGT